MKNRNQWLFEAPFGIQVNRVPRKTTQNTDVKDFGEGKPPKKAPKKPPQGISHKSSKQTITELGQKAVQMRNKLMEDYKNSGKGKNCLDSKNLFDISFRDFVSVSRKNTTVTPAVLDAFNALLAYEKGVRNCLAGIPPVSAEFERANQQLFEVPSQTEATTYRQSFLNLGNNQQWLFELPYESQEYHNSSSEADAMFDALKRWWGQRTKGQASSSSTPTVKRDRTTVSNELLTARNNLERKAKEYETLNCYDRINRPGKHPFPEQNLDLVNKCIDLRASMGNLKITISNLEKELKAL